MINTKTWYAIQVSEHGTDNFFVDGGQTFDSEKSAITEAEIRSSKKHYFRYDLKVVKKTLIEEEIQVFK